MSLTFPILPFPCSALYPDRLRSKLPNDPYRHFFTIYDWNVSSGEIMNTKEKSFILNPSFTHYWSDAYSVSASPTKPFSKMEMILDLTFANCFPILATRWAEAQFSFRCDQFPGYSLLSWLSALKNQTLFVFVIDSSCVIKGSERSQYKHRCLVTPSLLI